MCVKYSFVCGRMCVCSVHLFVVECVWCSFACCRMMIIDSVPTIFVCRMVGEFCKIPR